MQLQSSMIKAETHAPKARNTKQHHHKFFDRYHHYKFFDRYHHYHNNNNNNYKVFLFVFSLSWAIRNEFLIHANFSFECMQLLRKQECKIWKLRYNKSWRSGRYRPSSLNKFVKIARHTHMLISSPENRKEDILASFACKLYQMIKQLPNLREIPVGMLYLDDYLICFSFF